MSEPVPLPHRPDMMGYPGTGHGWQKCAGCNEQECPKPRLVVNHIDGPYVTWCGGTLRWLTFRERVRMFFGRLDLRSLRP